MGEGGEGIPNFPSWAGDKGRRFPACLLKEDRDNKSVLKTQKIRLRCVGGFSLEILNESAEANRIKVWCCCCFNSNIPMFWPLGFAMLSNLGPGVSGFLSMHNTSPRRCYQTWKYKLQTVFLPKYLKQHHHRNLWLSLPHPPLTHVTRLTTY